MFKYFNDDLQKVFRGMYTPNTDIHNYNARQHNNFHTSGRRTDIIKQGTQYQGVIQWNSLPNHIRV